MAHKKDPFDIDNLPDEALVDLYHCFNEKAGDSLKEENSPIFHELNQQKERYINKQPLAEGGMKSISKVFDQKTGRTIAFAELLKPDHVEHYENFLQEARLTSQLDHPNIITIHEIDVNLEGHPYFTMELKTGDSLDNILAKQKTDVNYALKFPLSKLLEIYLKVCDAVSYAHNKKIIHLDLKPANIQVGAHGEVVVCDWGLGKIIGQHNYQHQGDKFDINTLNPDLLNNITLQGQIQGTPGFMAPEQIRSHNNKDVRSDIYALGAILYCLITHNPPISGNTKKVIRDTLKGKIRPPLTRYPHLNIPQSLNAIVTKALQLKPEKRYQSVEELRQDVNNFTLGYTTKAEEPNLINEISSFYKRNKALCLISITAFLVTSTLSFYYISHLQRITQEALQAQQRAEDANNQFIKTHNLYTRERSGNKALKTEATRNILSDINKYFSIDFYDRPDSALIQALELTTLLLEDQPNSKFAHATRGLIHFISQDYKKAYDSFKLAPEGFEDLLELCDKSRSIKRENNFIAIHELLPIIDELSHGLIDRKILLAKCMFYDGTFRSQPYNHSLVVKEVIKAWNPGWAIDKKNQKLFRYSKKEATLYLRGMHLTRLKIPPDELWNNYKEKSYNGINLLNTLPIKTLNISNTGVENLNAVKDLSTLSQLFIAKTPIKSLSPLKFASTLKKLYVSKDQFTLADFAILPQYVHVVQK
ncbi:MAG: serine/threonine protein kinase [Planctomycetes bacterium]|nr:serine/threonine protein kinase [Planctomycetota bacterium]